MSGDWMRGVLSLLVVGGFLGVIAAFFFFPIKGDNTLFNVLLGALSTVGFASVIQFYFGSSSASKDKDAALIKSATGSGIGNGTAPPVAGGTH